MNATATADVIVVGLGAMGSATCSALAARGVSVIGIDRYRPPHSYGSTHGDTRITRLAIGEGPDYVPLVRRSHELWEEIERRTGAQLLTRTGGLVLAHAGARFLSQTRAVAQECGIDHENLSSTEIRARFPMFAVDRDTEAYYEPGAGYVRPEAAVRAQLELAARHGARLQFDQCVLGWPAGAGAVTVRTPVGVYEAQQLVLCAGPWIAELFAPGGDLFAVHRQLLYWFPIREGFERLREAPVFIWEFQGQMEEFTHFVGCYGFPAIDGPAGGVKVGTETYGPQITPDGRQHPATQAEIDEIYERYVAPGLPWLGSAPLRTVSCLYTSTRGSRFVIDRHPGYDTVLIVSPCSGHGFKHSPAIGEAVAQWVTDQPGRVDLGAFSLSRAQR